jgi:UDP-N-acetylmuramoyl-L-alanyl-D-glutamate--2,6-diaminopimelate ligase
MLLKDLLDGVRVIKLYSAMFGRMVLTQDISIREIAYDSRKVKAGDMFVAIRGTSADGHRFIDDAIAAGAVAILVDDDAARPDSLFMHEGVVKIVVADTRRALAQISSNFYGRPSEKLTLVGVTGTNGKTTTTHLVRGILESNNQATGLIGTIEYRIGKKSLPATHTTPESLELNGLLKDMVQEGCSAAVMEVSSHALALHRVDGLRFSAGVFTNLTQDHLDFHQTMDGYFAAKKRLFDGLSPTSAAIVNRDDPYGMQMVASVQGKVITYGTGEGADVRGTDIAMDIRGTRVVVEHAGTSAEVRSSLTGKFNVENILASFATGVGLGISYETIARGIGTVSSVRGRFEQIVSPDGWTAVVDYAHTPDALQHCLRTIREVLPPGKGHRVITVFGCGGNRDRGKRPMMGRIASELSDITFITSDNPRLEDPATIIDEVMAGVIKGKEVHTEPDRRGAIRAALNLAVAGDVVLVAGKGHETYQVIGAVREPLDDMEEVEKFIRGER